MPIAPQIIPNGMTDSICGATDKKPLENKPKKEVSDGS